jgi:DNA-binding winged helix-turn-helix (wHTH) protein
MNVNSVNKALGSPVVKFFTAIAIAFSVIFLLVTFLTDQSEEEVLSKRVNIAVRAIGHDLLLRSGDSSSLVPPVIEKSNGVFLLEFKNEFVFQPDTLVEIAQRVLSKTELAWYTVTVQKCDRPDTIVYGFEINPLSNNIMSCSGRTQPKACYTLEIAFADFPAPTILQSQTAKMIAGVILLLAVVVMSWNLISKKSRPQVDRASDQYENNSLHTVGRFVFDSAHQSLRIGEETISLTDKEWRILTLLNKNIKQLTPREELIQDVWTDEGVITGRSLDMFISKLRKKLSADPDLRITNIHGKGYRLEIVNDASV